MALATLRLDDSDEASYTLDIDTGTSSYYRIHLGKEVRREEGFVLLDGPYWSSPLRANPKAGPHLDTHTGFALDVSLVTEPGTLVQLETCRGPDGRGPAYSRPVRLPGYSPTRRGLLRPSAIRPSTIRPGMSEMSTATSSTSTTRTATRMVPVRSAQQTFSRPASIADLIGSVVQAAAPLVLGMLNQPSGGSSPSASTDPTSAMLANLLRTVLGALAKPPTTTGTTPPATPPAVAPPTTTAAAPVVATPPATTTTATTTAAPPDVSAPASLNNRLIDGPTDTHFTRPFIFGIDDALIGALAGPVLSSVAGPLIQMLPQLLNAGLQAKLARQQLTNSQVSDLLSQVDRTLLMQQLIGARSMPVNPGVTGSGPSDADLAALQALLQTAATAPAPTGTPAPTVGAAVAHTASLTTTPIPSKAVLSAVTGPAVTRLGSPRVVFVHDQAVTLRYRLDVGATGPARALPRAVLDVCVREAGGATDLLTRSQRLTDLIPGTEIAVPLSQADVQTLPADTDLELLAAIRWPGSKGTYQATSSQQVVFAGRVQVRDRGELVGAPVELTDMNRYRSFWNKVWSSPTTGGGPEALPLWGLDVAARYSVLMSPTDRGNGLMETRVQQEPHAAGLRAQTTGRLKSGVELSVNELNNLVALWPGEQPLSATDLVAFTAPGWLAGQGGDAVTQLRMEGKRGTRGLLWVVPVLSLCTFTLSRVSEVDPSGQVVATLDQPVHFPVVQSVRVLGLSSLRSASEPGEGAEVGTAETPSAYHFDGYDVVLNNLVGLEPAAPLPRTQAVS